MNEAATAPKLLTVDEAADQLGIGRSYLYSLIRQDKLAAVRHEGHRPGSNGALRIEQAEVIAYIERNRTRSAS